MKKSLKLAIAAAAALSFGNSAMALTASDSVAVNYFQGTFISFNMIDTVIDLSASPVGTAVGCAFSSNALVGVTATSTLGALFNGAVSLPYTSLTAALTGPNSDASCSGTGGSNVAVTADITGHPVVVDGAYADVVTVTVTTL